jgi:small-conductance mechanosensitive channel
LLWYFFPAISIVVTTAKPMIKLQSTLLFALLLFACTSGYAQLELNPATGGQEGQVQGQINNGPTDNGRTDNGQGNELRSERGAPWSQKAAVDAVESQRPTSNPKSSTSRPGSYPAVNARPVNGGPNPPAQTNTAQPTNGEPTGAQLLADAEAQLQRAKRVAENNGTDVPDVLQREVDLRKRTQGTLAQQEAAQSQSQELTTRLDQVNSALESLRKVGPEEQKPYSFLLLDHLRDDLTAQVDRESTTKATLESSEAAVIRAKAFSEEKEKQLRLGNEELQSSKDAVEVSKLTRDVQLAGLESKLASDVLTLRRMERSNEQLQQTVLSAQVEMLREKIRWIEKSAVFSGEDLQDQTVELDKRESDLQESLRAAEFNLQFAEVELSEARKQVEGTTEQAAELREKLASKQTTRQLYQMQVSLLNSRLQRLATDRETWSRRYKVITSAASPEEAITWGDETTTWLEQLEREKRLEQLRVDQLRQEIAGVEAKLQGVDPSAGNTRAWVELQRDRLSELIQVHDANIVDIEGSRRIHDKLRQEISGNVREWSLGEWYGWARHHFGELWNTEIARVDEHPITVGKVIVGILLIFFGFLLSRLLAKTLGKRMRTGRIRMHESGASAVQQISFYVLFVCFSLTALRFVNVPLTMFTFLGGAIAIGVGFGSQNIINNFISGLVLLAERPIKVGDLIQVGELYGNVEEIGARSTRIRTSDNLEIIVPNSRFLESDVINLTLGDNRLRTKVAIGVAYGSPTRKVEKLLLQAASENSKVLTTPDAFVWFSDFADNSLNFELHVWVRVRTLGERLSVESELRFRIDELFREGQIEIAFPQRDIHLDTVKPIEVKWVEEKERAA